MNTPTLPKKLESQAGELASNIAAFLDFALEQPPKIPPQHVAALQACRDDVHRLLGECASAAEEQERLQAELDEIDEFLNDIQTKPIPAAGKSLQDIGERQIRRGLIERRLGTLVDESAADQLDLLSARLQEDAQVCVGRFLAPRFEALHAAILALIGGGYDNAVNARHHLGRLAPLGAVHAAMSRSYGRYRTTATKDAKHFVGVADALLAGELPQELRGVSKQTMLAQKNQA